MTPAELAAKLENLAADWERYSEAKDHPLWNDVAADVYRHCARTVEQMASDVRAALRAPRPAEPAAITRAKLGAHQRTVDMIKGYRTAVAEEAGFNAPR